MADDHDTDALDVALEPPPTISNTENTHRLFAVIQILLAFLKPDLGIVVPFGRDRDLTTATNTGALPAPDAMSVETDTLLEKRYPTDDIFTVVNSMLPPSLRFTTRNAFSRALGHRAKCTLLHPTDLASANALFVGCSTDTAKKLVYADSSSEGGRVQMCSVTTRRMQGVGYRDFAAGTEVAESVGRLVKGLSAVGATFGGVPVDPPAAQKLLHSNFLLLRAAFRSKEELKRPAAPQEIIPSAARPPFTRESAIAIVRLDEDTWNNRDPAKVLNPLCHKKRSVVAARHCNQLLWVKTRVHAPPEAMQLEALLLLYYSQA